MSVDFFIRKPPVRRRIRRLYLPPDVTPRRDPLVPVLSENPRLIGTAFDYALRFYIKRHNDKARDKEWIAEKGVRRIEDLIKSGGCLHKQCGTVVGQSGNMVAMAMTDRDPNKTLREVKTLLKQSRYQYLEYLSTGIASRDLMQACYSLAKLDRFYRAFQPLVPEDLYEIDEKAIDELLALLRVVDLDLFSAKRRCFLNPVLRAGHIVYGADADLLIDDRLIEIKVSRSRKPGLRDWDQLFAYYCLYQIGGVEGLNRRTRIQRLGIYNARYAQYFEMVLIPEQMDYGKSFAEWLVKRISSKTLK